MSQGLRYAYVGENDQRSGELGNDKGKLSDLAPVLISLRSEKAKKVSSKKQNNPRKRTAHKKKDGDNKTSFKRTNRVEGDESG